MIRIDFYNYDGMANVINKTLPTPVSVQGSLRGDTDVLRPIITIRQPTRPTFNYCHIETFGRYYFIDSVTFDGDNRYELSLRVDPLKTYDNEILDAMATLTQADGANRHISTRNTVYDKTPNLEKIEFTNKGLLNEEGTIIMVTLRGTGSQTN